MKKLLLLAILGSAAFAFGQGTVIFNNNASANYNLWTNNALGTASNLMAGAGNYRIGLYASTNAGASAGSLALVGLATNAPLAGKFNGGSTYVLPDGYPTSVPMVFQIRAWSFAGGTSYEQAFTASLADPFNIALGTSPLGTVTPGGGVIQAAALFGTSAGQLARGFEIRPVPEPSSIALGLLGLGAVALLRRRK